MDGDTIIKLVNPTDEDYIDYHADKRYRIPAHGHIVCQAGPLHEWLGDPDIRDVDRNKERTREVTRLRARYGAYENNDVWERNKPPIEAWTMDDQRIITIVDDPQGATFGDFDEEWQGDSANLAAQIAQLQAQISMLQAAAGVSGSTLTASDPVPAGPPPASRQRQRKATDPDVAAAIAADLPVDEPDRTKVG